VYSVSNGTLYTGFAAALTFVLFALLALYVAGRLPVGNVGDPRPSV
jgi:hypothetical protein